jgi:hypothetical protein
VLVFVCHGALQLLELTRDPARAGCKTDRRQACAPAAAGLPPTMLLLLPAQPHALQTDVVCVEAVCGSVANRSLRQPAHATVSLLGCVAAVEKATWLGFSAPHPS